MRTGPAVVSVTLLLCASLGDAGGQAARAGDSTAALSRPSPGACRVIASRRSLGELSGALIRDVRVVTANPTVIRAAARLAQSLHVRTRAGTIRRLVLLVPGDTVDTLRVAETLRRLRTQDFITDPRIEGSWCGDRRSVTLTVRTRDVWSTQPDLRVGMGTVRSSGIGLAERNLLGTGQSAAISLTSRGGRTGLGMSWRAPEFLGSPLAASGSLGGYSDGGDWRAALETSQRSASDGWQGEIRLRGSTRYTAYGAIEQVVRHSAIALATRRVASSAYGGLFVSGGVESSRLGFTASSDALLLGPAHVERDYRGVVAGVSRIATAYDTVSWILSRDGILDLPVALETDVIVGAGRDATTGLRAERWDGWIGRAWTLGNHAFLVGDAWGRGFREAGDWHAGSLRSAVSLFHQAPRGYWQLRVSTERLINPDPDVRALGSFDPTANVFPLGVRFARKSFATSLERSAHVLALSGAWGLDVAGFAAASTRWEPVTAGEQEVSVAMLGVGLRLVPSRAGRGAVHLDIGVPVAHDGPEARRLLIGIGLTPGLMEGRSRDGRRAQ